VTWFGYQQATTQTAATNSHEVKSLIESGAPESSRSNPTGRGDISAFKGMQRKGAGFSDHPKESPTTISQIDTSQPPSKSQTQEDEVRMSEEVVAQRQKSEPLFQVPLAFATSEATRGPVPMSRAREWVPGAFSGAAGLPATPASRPQAASDTTSPPPDEQQAIERLQNTFVETMRNSGLDPNNAEYLQLWNAAQSASDQQYAIWYGWDRAAARQAAAYKLASEQARAASSPAR
jgi:hypothetical protein